MRTHDPLSPARNIAAVRWPPKNYTYDPTIFGEIDYCSSLDSDANRLRELYPELSNWKSKYLVLAWDAYGQDTAWFASEVPSERDDYFLAYLYAKQELNFSGCGLDELDEEWSKVL